MVSPVSGREARRTSLDMVRLFCSVLLVASCGAQADLPEPPLPGNQTGLDPQVASEMQQRAAGVERDPANVQAWMDLGAVYQAHGESEPAAVCYRAVTTLDPDQPRAHYLLALAENRLGRSDTAIDELRQAAALAPDYLPIRLHLGLWLLEADRVQESLAALGRVPASDAGDSAVVGLLARANLQAGDSSRAVAVLEEHLARNDSDRYARGLLARAYRRLGRINEAERELARGDSEQPAWDDPWLKEVEGKRVGFSARLEQATALLETQPQTAVELLERLHGQRPDNSSALINLGIGLRRTGRLEESAGVLARAVKIESGRGLAHMHLALTRAQMARRTEPASTADLDAALEHARTAVELQPTASRNRAVLAEVLAQADRLEDAVAAYREAVADPQDPGWNLRLGQLLCRLERWGDAVDPLVRYLAERGEDAEGLLFLGIARANLGQVGEARAVLERARSLRPDDPRIETALRQLAAAGHGVGST